MQAVGILLLYLGAQIVCVRERERERERERGGGDTIFMTDGINLYQ